MEIRVWTDGETQATLTLGDCIEVMATMEPGSIHAIVTDPPYGLEFMGKSWDKLGGDAGMSKPGIGERDISWPSFGGDPLGGSNPTCATCGGRKRGKKKCACLSPDWRVKGQRLSKANAGTQMQAWHARWLAEAYRVLKPGGYIVAFGGTRTYHRLVCAAEDAGFEIRDSLHWMYGSGFPKSLNVGKALEAWDGWGTALKPAHEPIMLARKPLIGTVAKNVLAHGTGALNIDACRVGTDAGRWPPNILLTHSAACEIVGERVVKGDDRKTETGAGKDGGGFADVGAERTDEQPGGKVYPSTTAPVYACTPDCPVATLDAQNEGASRFFPPLYWEPVHDAIPFLYSAKTAKKEREQGRPDDCTDKRWNTHPTVKPVALMAWLLKLVGSAPDAVVLDPFAGSGTTLCAGLLHGIETIGIEREAAYVEIARRRMAAWSELGE